MSDSSLDDSEQLLRRVLRRYVTDDGNPPSFESFRPRDYDTDGLSLWRAEFRSMRWVATPQREGAAIQLVAVVTVGAMRKLGVDLVIDPAAPVDHSHVIATNLRFNNRTDAQQEEWQQQLASSICEIYDPAEEPAKLLWPTASSTTPEPPKAPLT